MSTNTSNRRWGRAWVLLCLALAVHVADEALTGFLGFWNPAVRSMRASLPWLPLPTFSFGIWLGGLVALVALLLSLSRFAFQGARWMRPLSAFLAVIMFFNGLGHAILSLYLGRPAPGVYSAPLLLGAAVYLWKSVPPRSQG